MYPWCSGSSTVHEWHVLSPALFPAAIFLQEHPAGGKLAVASKDGLIQLITKPAIGAGKPGGSADVVSTFLDLRGRVTEDNAEQGLLGFAFHPRFLKNGRFFVSYICDGTKSPDCRVRHRTPIFLGPVRGRSEYAMGAPGGGCWSWPSSVGS